MLPLLSPRPVYPLVLRIKGMLFQPLKALCLPLCVLLLLLDQVVGTYLLKLLICPYVLCGRDTRKVGRMAIFAARLWVVETCCDRF